jgi:hypothetical protein
MTGINIQNPWSSLLINGLKVVETRTYPIPDKYIGQELALIETPGKKRNFKSRIIGTITFSHSFKYPDESAWIQDFCRHKVDQSDKLYGWNSKPKYGWVVSSVTKFDKYLESPKIKGIIFTKNCNII